MNRLSWCVILFVAGWGFPASSAERSVSERLARETWVKDSRLVASAIGVTRREVSIPCLIDREELEDKPNRQHVWLVGGLDGTNESVDATFRLLRWFHSSVEAKACASGWPFRRSSSPIRTVGPVSLAGRITPEAN